MKKIPYYKVLELLIYLQVMTCPDFLFTVNYLSHFASNSGKAYWEAMKHTITYVKNTIDYGITYHYRANLQHISFFKSDYVNNQNTKRLIDRYIFYIGRELVS